MATTNNILLNKVSGQLGKEVVFKQYGDKTVLSKYPDMTRRKLTPKQKRINTIMADANEVAREILADEEQRDAAQVRLNVTRNRLYTALIREYFKSALSK
jgi:hypothetical protein